MTDREVLLQMKDILERMHADEDEKYNENIQVAYWLVEKELLKSEPDVMPVNVLVAALLAPIFKERGLPLLPLSGAANDV